MTEGAEKTKGNWKAPTRDRCEKGTSAEDLTFTISGEPPPAVLQSKQTYCVTMSAEFDQDWGIQQSPDPKLQPQSHAARLRLNEHYTAFASDGDRCTCISMKSTSRGDMQLNEFKTKLFPVGDLEVVATPAGLVSQMTTTTTTSTQ
eukprot:3870875-Amphidinium_carterae.1